MTLQQQLIDGIRAQSAELGLTTQAQIAGKLNRPQQYVAKIFGGKQSPTLAQVENLCRDLGLEATLSFSAVKTGRKKSSKK